MSTFVNGGGIKPLKLIPKAYVTDKGSVIQIGSGWQELEIVGGNGIVLYKKNNSKNSIHVVGYFNLTSYTTSGLKPASNFKWNSNIMNGYTDANDGNSTYLDSQEYEGTVVRPLNVTNGLACVNDQESGDSAYFDGIDLPIIPNN